MVDKRKWRDGDCDLDVDLAKHLLQRVERKAGELAVETIKEGSSSTGVRA
jgi:hypothetical protein